MKSSKSQVPTLSLSSAKSLAVIMLALGVSLTSPTFGADFGFNQVIISGPRTPVLVQIKDFKKDPQQKEAYFTVTAPKEVKAICKMTRLEKLTLSLKLDQEKSHRHYRDETEKALEQISKLRNLKTLRISFDDRTKSPDEVLKKLSQLPRLTSLALEVDKDQSNGEKSPLIKVLLPPLPSVETLKLTGVDCEYEFSKSAPLDSIKILSCGATLLNQSDLKRLVNLKELQFETTLFTPEGEDALASLPKLRSLTCDEPSKLPIQRWAQLEKLDLSGVEDLDIEKISQLSNLKELHLNIYSCSDNFLKKLGALSKLQKLELRFTDYSTSGENKLNENLDGSGLACFRNSSALEELSVVGLPLNDKLLEAVSEISSLKSLRISSSDEIALAKLTFINKLKNLEQLNLDWPRVGMITFLGASDSLSHLKNLNLHDQNIDDKQLSILKKFPSLEQLDLSNNKLTGKSLDILKGLKNLANLNLSHNPIGDAELLKHSLTNQRLKMLNLASTDIKGSSLSTLSNLPCLLTLDLSGNNLEDEGLANLETKSLEELSVNDTYITERGIANLDRRTALKYVSALNCGIKYGVIFPSSPQVDHIIGWYECNYDRPKKRAANRKLRAQLNRMRQGNGPTGLAADRQQADVYLATGNFKEAIEKYKKALEDLTHPKYRVCSLMATAQTDEIFECYDQLGLALAANKEYEASLEALDSAVDIARASAFARTHRAFTYLRLGRLQEALKDLNRAIDINPKIAAAYEYRAEVYQKLGETELMQKDKNQSKKLGYQPEFGQIIAEAQ